MKFRNVSGVDLEVSALGVIVPAGEVLDVDGPLAEGLVGQDSVWAPVVARAAVARPKANTKKTTTKQLPADPPADAV